MKTLALANATVYLVALLMVQSTFSNFLGSGVAVLCLATATFCILVGIGLAVLDGRVLACTVLVAITAVIVFQLELFSIRSGYPIQWNIFFSYVPMMCFILFVNRNLRYDDLFRSLFYISVVYSVIYIMVYNVVVNADVLPTDEAGARVLVSDGVRDARVFLAATFPTFSFFYALTRIRRAKLFYGAAFAVSLGAMIMSQSRLHLALVAIATMMYLTGFSGFRSRLVILSLFMLSVLIVLFAVVFSWNPLVVVQGDPSGAARAVTFSVLQEFVSTHFVLGIGLPSTRIDDSLFLGRLSVFWDDVGVIGIWYVFGFIGVLFYCFHAGLCIMGPTAPERQIERVNLQTLTLSGLVLGMACIISPAVWLGSGTVIQGIAFGIFLRGYRRKSPLFRRKQKKAPGALMPRDQRPQEPPAAISYGRR